MVEVRNLVKEYVISGLSDTAGRDVSLSAAAIPFFARIVETSLREFDKGVIEVAVVVGDSPWMILKDVLLPEAKLGIVQGLTITTISLVAYLAMAGIVGAEVSAI